MKVILLILKIVFAPIWLPFWFVRKFWKLWLVLFVISQASGCASSSNTFEKSPCACVFERTNVGNYAADPAA